VLKSVAVDDDAEPVKVVEWAVAGEYGLDKWSGGDGYCSCEGRDWIPDMFERVASGDRDPCRDRALVVLTTGDTLFNMESFLCSWDPLAV